MYSPFIVSHMALHVSRIMTVIVERPSRNSKCRERNEFPVPRYLQNYLGLTVISNIISTYIKIHEVLLKLVYFIHFVTGKEVQKRWKSMKDSYMKNIKNNEGKSGDPMKSKKPYVYHKQLSFLQTVIQPREYVTYFLFFLCYVEITLYIMH